MAIRFFIFLCGGVGIDRPTLEKTLQKCYPHSMELFTRVNIFPLCTRYFKWGNWINLIGWPLRAYLIHPK